MGKLTAREKKFVDNYTGNATIAAKAAGIKGSAEYIRLAAHRLITKDNVIDAIKKKEMITSKSSIASAEEILEFFTDVQRDKGLKMADRIKAAELSGKAKAMFSEKRIIEGGDNPLNVNLGWMK
jgi:phage terminase small subunit